MLQTCLRVIGALLPLLDNFHVVGSAIPPLRIAGIHQSCPRSIAGGRLALWVCSSAASVGWSAVAEKTFTSIVVWKRVPDMCVHVAVQSVAMFTALKPSLRHPCQKWKTLVGGFSRCVGLEARCRFARAHNSHEREVRRAKFADALLECFFCGHFDAHAHFEQTRGRY